MTAAGASRTPLIRSLHEALGGRDGIAQLHAALDRAEAARSRWEADHPGLRFGQPCHCRCDLRGHDPGVCTGTAVTVLGFELHGAPVPVAHCQPCADLSSPRR